MVHKGHNQKVHLYWPRSGLRPPEWGPFKWAHLPSSPRLLQWRAGLDFKSSPLSLIFPFKVVRDHCFSCLNGWSNQARINPPAEASGLGANVGQNIRMLPTALCHCISGHSWSDPAGPVWPQPWSTKPRSTVRLPFQHQNFLGELKAYLE